MYLCRVHETIIIIGDPSATDMPDPRPIQDLDMLHWRKLCLIRKFKHNYLNILIFIYLMLIYIKIM